MSGIVVGVDGSPGAQRALEWAVREAKLRGADLTVAHVHSLSRAAFYTAYSAAEDEQTLHAAADRVRRETERLLAQAVDGLGDLVDGVNVKQVAVPGDHAARELVTLSADADLLVVGSRGRGGFTGLLLGSVSQQSLHHATCPVAVVPTE